jgi:hypothetical protein
MILVITTTSSFVSCGNVTDGGDTAATDTESSVDCVTLTLAVSIGVVEGVLIVTMIQL